MDSDTDACPAQVLVQMGKRMITYLMRVCLHLGWWSGGEVLAGTWTVILMPVSASVYCKRGKQCDALVRVPGVVEGVEVLAGMWTVTLMPVSPGY